MSNPPNPYLVATSLLFVIPTTTMAYYGQWWLYSTTLFLTLASSLYHATKYQPLLIVDKTACNLLTVVHMYYAHSHGIYAVPMTGIAYCGLVFTYGNAAKRFVFDPCRTTALRWHMSMHLVVLFAVLYGSLVTGKIEDTVGPVLQ
jgi:hypothetical protein